MKQGRNTLRKYFAAGRLPSEDHFQDLIDSNLNMEDEGFSKSEQHGFKVAPLGTGDSLISFFRNINFAPLWRLAFRSRDGAQAGEENLVFGRPHGAEEEDAAVLSFAPQGRVGINLAEPAHALDVAGEVRSSGRLGVETVPAGGVLANGKWQPILTGLQGCQAFEVVAGAGNPGKGYALMHAIAVNAFNPTAWPAFNLFGRKNRIRCTHAYYMSRDQRLGLRWAFPKERQGAGKRREYQLEIRSQCDYGGNTPIRFHLTRLWFDDMTGLGE